ncbi:MAG TPA: CPBP family intramembrane glutamic endopeptidase, partial [Pirellulales bacterium]
LQWMCISLALKFSGIPTPETWADLDSHAKFMVVLGDLVSRLLTLVVGTAIVVVRTGATANDLGLNHQFVTYDLRCGALAFVASLPLVYGVQALVTHWIPYEHQLIDVVHQSNASATWLAAVVSAVVAAPLTEEFLFRILLQGWLEKLELSLMLRMSPAQSGQLDEKTDVVPATGHPQPGLLGLPIGTLPILISSSLFALTHFREGPESVPLRLFAVTPLLVFGLFLGFVYQRTHRLLPSLTIHMLLNGLTMASLFAGA